MDPVTHTVATVTDLPGPGRGQLPGGRRRGAPETVVEGVVATYVVGYLVGRSIGILWARGPAGEQGLRRLASGAAGMLQRPPAA